MQWQKNNNTVSVFIFSVFLSVSISVLIPSLAFCESKSWSGSGDGISWGDEDNWSPAIVPGSADDVTISEKNAAVEIGATFNAKSLTVGGNAEDETSVTSKTFVFGDIEPDATTDVGILNRSKGKIIMKGVGTVTVKGKYVDSNEIITAEPSFMFWIK